MQIRESCGCEILHGMRDPGARDRLCSPQSPGRRVLRRVRAAAAEPGEPPAIDYARPQSYTPTFLAEKILTQRSSVEGERKVLTVMFTDVANFTPLSERVGPEVVHQIMDGCFRILLDETHRYEGTIDQTSQETA